MAETITLKSLRELVAGQLGLLIDTVIDVAVDGNTYTIDRLADKSPDAERMRDAYLYQSAVWSRILSFGYPATNDVETARNVGLVAGAAQIYFMLDPDDLNAAINEALKELYFVEKDTITLLADTTVYALPAWVQQKGQILNLKWRDVSVLSTDPHESELASYSINEDNNTCTVVIHEALRSITSYDLQVYGRRNFSMLASDSATTTCPYQLAFTNSMSKVLQRLFNKFGKGVASLFGPKMMENEKNLMKAKSDYLPRLTARDYILDDRWEGPDINPVFESPSW